MSVVLAATLIATPLLVEAEWADAWANHLANPPVETVVHLAPIYYADPPVDTHQHSWPSPTPEVERWRPLVTTYFPASYFLPYFDNVTSAPYKGKATCPP